MTLKTEFITGIKSGTTMSFNDVYSKRIVNRTVRNLKRTNRRLLVTSIILVAICLGLGYQIYRLQKNFDYVLATSTVEEKPIAVVNEDLSSFTLTPVDVPPLKK